MLGRTSRRTIVRDGGGCAPRGRMRARAPEKKRRSRRVGSRPPRRRPHRRGAMPSPAVPTRRSFLTVAQFIDVKKPDGKTQPVPGAAKLLIVRADRGRLEGRRPSRTPTATPSTRRMPWEGGILTIGANQAMLKTWRFADGAWTHDDALESQVRRQVRSPARHRARRRRRRRQGRPRDRDPRPGRDRGRAPRAELARRGGRPAARHVRPRDRDRRRRRRRRAGDLRDAEQAEQARPGAAGRGRDVPPHRRAAGRSRSSTRPATPTPRRSWPPTSTATASPSSTSCGRARSARAGRSSGR